MKKIFFITAGIIVCIVLCYTTIKKKYIKNYLEVEHRWMVNPLYVDPYYNYAFYNNLELPQTVEPILEDVKKTEDYLNDQDYVEFYINLYLRDYLSKEKPGYIHYIPLYNPDNKKREGFILLSTGIDGKINNRYDWRDTLFLNDYKHKLKLYDVSKFISDYDTITYKTKVYFNIFNYFFGKKDILIREMNFIEAYKCRGHRTVDLENLIKDVEYKSTLNDDFTHKYKGAFQKDTFIDNDRYIFFRYDDYLIRNKLYSGRDVILSDTIVFVGISDSFDGENKVIDLRSCIQADEKIELYILPATWE